MRHWAGSAVRNGTIVDPRAAVRTLEGHDLAKGMENG